MPILTDEGKCRRFREKTCRRRERRVPWGCPTGLRCDRRRDNRCVRSFTLEYWQDEGWYVGRLREVPGVMSQGETLADLEENIRDAYRLIVETEPAPDSHPVQTRQIEV